MPEPPGGGSPLSRIPKPVLLGGGAVVVGVGYIFYRKRKSAAAAAATANSDNTSTQMGAASGGAYGNPLPGSGMLAPILINVGGSGASTTDPGANPPNPPQQDPGGNLPIGLQPPPPVPASGIPPPIAAFLAGKTMEAGENIVQEVADPLGGWLALTNKGGVYTYGGAPFMGSYLGYADQTKDPAAEKAGRGSFTQIVPRSNGGYTLIDQHGETYNFDPGTPKSAGGTG